ncbi:MAG TPA: oligosaccharide flippase family protein [Acidimicrobiales bacterium]|nr:oligosaccharide flippase family protein [Acidimicrobiales bacterium]
MTGSDGGGRSIERRSDSVAAAQGTAALALGQVFTRALGLGFVLVATRAVAPTELGRYAVASALLLGASSIADLGTTSVVTKLVSRAPHESARILGAVVIPSFVLGVLALSALTAFVLIFDYPSVTRTDTLLAGLGLPADAVLTSLFGGFDGRGLLTRRAWLSLARTTFTIGGGIAAILATRDVRMALIALGAGPNVALVLGIVAARRSGLWTGRPRSDPEIFRAVLRQALPFALLGGINVIVLRADVVILSLLAAPSTVARYDVALRATEALGFLGSVVAAPSLFILSRRLGAGDSLGAQRAFDEATRLAYLIGLALSAVLVAIGTPVAAVVFGEKYRAAGTLLSILGLQLWLALIAAIQGSLLLAGGELRRAVKFFSSLAAGAVVVQTTAIMIAGAIGAAVAMVVVQSSIVTAAALFSRRYTGVSLRRPPVGALIAALASGATMALTSSSLWLPWVLIVGAAVYLVIVVGTRTVDADDVRRLRGRLRPTGI